MKFVIISMSLLLVCKNEGYTYMSEAVVQGINEQLHYCIIVECYKNETTWKTEYFTAYFGINICYTLGQKIIGIALRDKILLT